MTHRDTLRELAYDTHGVVTLSDAIHAGVPAVEVRKLASRGALERRGKGVYRMTEAPHTPLDEFAEAVAIVGQGAVLADESVLAALDLGQVNLRRIKVATDKRVRHAVPATVEVVHRHVDDRQRDSIDGIPSMTLPAALLAARATVLPERLVDAVRKATARELISHREAEQLLEVLTK
jgi:predicted transcriptional regulator of viral defense system